ncbi:hypothetical protein EDB85DRAFT_1971509 [Lactarius pseudohatsudake]|nr:hypothetical protein EDB85DRAFT_1976999 [Lactarius pseudohatsudake]KAH9028225.1 hypothetical protein EDB85DRAFT_1971509 [Lactarius pseudohatsudake]
MGSIFLATRHRLPICAGVTSWSMTGAFINGVASWMIDRFHRLPFPPFRCYSFPSTILLTMPALFPVDEFHGALFIATVLSSMCISLSVKHCPET